MTETVPAINTLDSLRQHLQDAIEVEHSTVPVYLTALYSLVDGANADARRVIRSVVMEEMLHMSLVANVLTAVGGQPAFNHPRFIPQYPAPMPFSDGAIILRLQTFSPEAIALFRRIELPAAVDAPPQADKFHTIGQFYEAVALGLEYLCDTLGEDAVFTGNRDHQVGAEHYYGGGGGLFPIRGRREALHAIRFIVIEGEGLDRGISDGDQRFFDQDEEPAHYFQFNQIRLGRYYQPCDTPQSGPSGAPLPVDWGAVHPMQPDPSMARLPPGSPLYQRALAFNSGYSRLLDELTLAFNGAPERFDTAIAEMYRLKHAAQALMRMRLPGSRRSAGPSFEYVPAQERV